VRVVRAHVTNLVEHGQERLAAVEVVEAEMEVPAGRDVPCDALECGAAVRRVMQHAERVDDGETLLRRDSAAGRSNRLPCRNVTRSAVPSAALTSRPNSSAALHRSTASTCAL